MRLERAMGSVAEQQSMLPPLPATIHLVGIGGIGVSGLARILLDRGYTVTGSDLADSPTIEELRRLGIDARIGHEASHVGDAALVIRTAAAPDSNPELQEASRRGIPVIKRAQLLGELSALRMCLAVAGSHGKSTTAGMLACALHRAGEDPSYAVGAVVSQLGSNAAPGSGRHFVVEADEYDYSFLTLSPDVAIITNIEHDHPDLFPNLDSIDRAYERFVERLRRGGSLILSSDDPGCNRLRQRIAGNSPGARVVTVGRSEAADWRLHDERSPFFLRAPDGSRFNLSLSVPGAHNRLNAAMVLAACSLSGVDLNQARDGVEAFTGVGRRFDFRAEIDGVRILDDYAHHPTELIATIQATRERYPDGRIWAVFQPHTYSRTKHLLREFASALDTSDVPVLVEIYPARETDTLGVSSGSIAAEMKKDAQVYPSPESAASAVADGARSGDVVLFLGAGDIWRASPALIDRLTSRAGPND